MADMNIAAAEAALKPLMKDEIVPQFEQEVNISKMIKKAEDVEFLPAKGFRIPMKFRPPAGGGRGGEGMAFGTPNAWRLGDMYVYPVQYAFPGTLTGRAIRNFKSTLSLVQGLSGIMAEYTTAAAKDKEVGLFNDGSGLRATVASVASQTITCATAGAAAFGSTKGAVHLIEGETYDVVSSAGTVRGQILAKTITASTVVADATTAMPGGTTAGDMLIRQGNYLYHETGLAKLISNSSDVVQLINRAVESKAKSSVLDLADGSLSVSALTKAKAILKNRRGVKAKEMVTAILPTSQKEYLLRIGHNLKEFTSSEKNLDVTFDSFAVGATQFVEAVDCCENRVYFVDFDDLRWYESMPFGEYNLDGNILRMKHANGYGSDVYYFAIGWEGNYGISSFRNHLLINRCNFTDLATQVASYS